MSTVKKYTETKQLLDSISSSMCFAKWTQVSIRLGDGYNHSCHHPAKHLIPLSELKHNPSALHNTEFKKTIRRQMLAGKRPNECNYCWIAEDSKQEGEDFYSDRIKKSSQDWSRSLADKIISDPELNINPPYVEVSFNNTCNLKCSYCSPQFSSSWQQEVEQHGAYPTSTAHNDPSHFQGRNRPIPVREHNPYVEAFWQWWPELYKEIEHLRMTGGEPLMDKNT